jgi:hypothetical protein
VAADALLRPEAWTGLGSLPSVILWEAVLLAAAVVLITRKLPKLHPAVMILACAVIGAVFRFGGA